MRWGVITFPGSCDDQDVVDSLKLDLGHKVKSLWHKDELSGSFDCLVLPGGFSYGDYLRCGAMARFSPIMRGVVKFAQSGGLVLGICNGFQILCESGLLPGALVRNVGLQLSESGASRAKKPTPRSPAAKKGQCSKIRENMRGLHYAERGPESCENANLALRTSTPRQDEDGANPNGSLENIAGICNETRNVFGLMPHPEDACNKLLGSEDGAKIFSSIAAALAEKVKRHD